MTSHNSTRVNPESYIEVEGRRWVVIRLNADAADWLASELPVRDGFTRDVARAARRLRDLNGERYAYCAGKEASDVG